MTEAEWLTCGNARAMLTFLGAKPGQRKLRLFTCACWRQRWPGPSDPASARAVAAAERYADGLCPWEKVEAAHKAAERSVLDAGRALDEAGRGNDREAFRAAQDRQRMIWAAVWTAGHGYTHAPYAPDRVLRLVQQWATKKQRAGFADLAREVFVNPFRAVVVDPAWLTANGGLVRRLAQSIYDERRFGDLGVLADALEEAGCGADDLLAHCRSPGPHVLGCWVVDLLLSKG